eukprot:TRINITY_DN2298_c0_g1_i1.p1 TRINITY_DN2298_c0_g1~~TRINITY_DN2298_c0_g1_i1.p1  ORF type:complete len:119 (-),score=37.41 TRINITY_DN2298_c0_g1_i1:523-879(-)
MKQLFKDTSQFTVDSAIKGNDMLYDQQVVFEEGIGYTLQVRDFEELLEMGKINLGDDDEDFDSEESDELSADEPATTTKTRKARASRGERKPGERKAKATAVEKDALKYGLSAVAAAS